ncbi:MAG: S8 family serine peptidase, partial [Methanocellales archaeon]|nr:S8 family serine peptidase [Methanocellales archaeon]
MKGILLKIASVLICLLFVMSTASASFSGDFKELAPQDLNPKIGSLLEEEIKAKPGEKIPIIIVLKEQPREIFGEFHVKGAKSLAARSQWTLVTSLEQTQAEDIRQHWIINAISAKVPANMIDEIAARQDVEKVWLDAEIKLIEPVVAPATTDYGDDNISAPLLWDIGYNGTGINISILDTGIDKSHPDLDGGKVILEVNYTGEGTDDLHGHGTHCAGIAAGEKNTTSGVRGVAPGASLLNAKVLNQSGTGLTSWFLSGIEWSMNNHADVLSMSLGSWQGDGTGRDPISEAVANAASQVVVVVAAGNEGPGEATIASPAVAYNATIAVAASDMYDTIANFSSRGPTGDGRVGVDLAAPGVAIIAPNATWEEAGEYYAVYSGTSMSAPHVAGAVALLLQANSTLTPGDVERTLKNSADDISGILEQGAGRLDVYDAYDALTNGTLVDHEWYVGKVYAGDYTKTFTVINKNATANVTLSITKSNMTDTQGNDAGDWMTLSTASLFILNESSAPFDVTMSVPSTAVGTYIGNITLVNTTNVPMTNITIPISVNVMQRVDGITIEHMTETLDEDLYTSPKADFPCGDWVYYTLDVQAGVANLNLSLDWTSAENDLDIVLFNTTGECTVSYLDKPEKISVENPNAGKWTVAINAWNLTTPETYNLTVIGSWSNTSLWHMTSKKAHTDHSWWYGIEENNTYNTGTANSGTLTSGPIDLRGMTSPNLRFYTWWETEQGTTWDKKIVQISTDGGANWQELMQVSEDNVTMGAWHLVKIDLSGYVNNVIMIRFYFDTVDSILNDYWGWFIDDIVV